MTDFFSGTWSGLCWLPWIPLDGDLSVYQEHTTTNAGIYRVRIVGQTRLAYLGQTGRDLRERLRSLSKQTYRPIETPPWNDPHTGAPGLWAWRVEEGYAYEASVAPLELAKEERECFEDMLLFQYRLQQGESTLCNHGRFHPRWVRPSNRQGGRGMQRLAYGHDNTAGGASLSPVVVFGDPTSSDWLALPWSPRQKLSTTESYTKREGVYRLFDNEEVVYLGQSSSLQERLWQHAKRFKGWEMAVSYVEMPKSLPHHLLERETDLIGAFYTQMRKPPRFQYGQG